MSIIGSSLSFSTSPSWAWPTLLQYLFLGKVKDLLPMVLLLFFGLSEVSTSSRHSAGYCTVLYCTVLYCIVLYCIVLYHTVQYCAVVYCTVLYHTVLHLFFHAHETFLFISVRPIAHKCKPPYKIRNVRCCYEQYLSLQVDFSIPGTYRTVHASHHV